MRSARGNILFLILLAVVLFAALAYAVTSSMRGGGRDAGTESAKTNAASIINYFALVESTIQRMLLTGVRPEHLDFSTSGSVYTTQSSNSNCSEDSCRVFKQVTPLPAPRKASHLEGTFSSIVWTPEMEGKFYASMLSIKYVGTTLPEIVIGYKGLNKDTCDQINILAGVYQQGDAMIDAGENLGTAATDYKDFQSNMDPLPSLTADKWGSIDSRLIGKTTFCFRRNTVSGYYAVHVVVPR